MHGVLVVDKPEGPTSHDVVARCRRVLATREIGHAGTLDPMATGVLVLVIGRATRLARFLAGQAKTYDADLRLGKTTDTWDRTGTDLLCPEPASWPDPEALAAALSRFMGPRLQTPPPYSAKRIQGVRAHVLARRGQPVAVEPAAVELHDCRIVEAAPRAVRLHLRCSAGYYVRSLVHDLGEALGCGACLEALRRTASGGFALEDAAGLAALEEDPVGAAHRVIPLERLLLDLPSIHLDEAEARRAGHGNEVAVPEAGGGLDLSRAPLVRLLAPDGTLLAVATPADRPGFLHPSVVLK